MSSKNRLSDREKKAHNVSEEYSNSKIVEFGTDKFRNDFTIEANESIDRFSEKMRDNLYAIVMPSCSGKTTMCDRYGFVDVDRCTSTSEHEFLNEMRISILNEKLSWDEHNKYWLNAVNSTLDLFDYSRPVVIMVHTEMIALNLGALPLIGLFPDDNLFSKVLDKITNPKKEGDRPNKMRANLARMNRKEFMSHSNIVMRNKRSFKSFEDMESLIIRTLIVNDLPVVAPYKYSRRVLTNVYGDECPSWVLTGDRSKLNIDTLIGLWNAKSVPKECMDYFLRGKDIPSSFGFGMRMNEWSTFIANARSVMSDKQNFDVGGDMGKIFPYVGTKMQTRTNINVQRLVKGCDIFVNDKVYDLATSHVGRPNNFVTAVLTYWIGLGDNMKGSEILFKLLGVSYFHWVETFKVFHNLIRVSKFFMNTEIDEKERQSLMYINLLVGKEDAEADWKKEIDDRTCDDPSPEHRSYNKELGLWTKTQYWKDFTVALDEAYMRMGVKSDVSIENYDDFYKNRYNWLTKGSIVYNDLDSSMKKYTVDLINEVGEVVNRTQTRHNKKSLFEVMDAINEMETPFELMNLTKMVTKMDECGHAKRALFPGSLMHYMIFCYVLYFAEKQGQVANVRLNATPDDDISYFETKMTGDIPRLLFDWTNFNAYHSMDEMAMVIDRLGDVVNGPSDYKYFCRAIAELMYNMVFEDPEKNRHHLNRGLYSGWRGTTWINTVLNAVYVKTAEMSYIKMYDEEPFRYVDGGGDDLDAGLNNRYQGMRMLSVMKSMNFQSKEIKQMVDDKSEFFRITIDSKGAYASATRALAMFVNGKWEGSGQVPIQERIVAILDQIGKIVRRGFDNEFANSLAVICLSHWCKVGQNDEWLSLPAVFLHGREEDNCLGIPDREGRVWRLSSKMPEPVKIQEMGKPPGKKASHDYLAKLAREMRIRNIEIIDIKRLEDQMAISSFETYDKYDYSEILKSDRDVVEKIPIVKEKDNKMIFDVFSEWTGVSKPDKDYNRMKEYVELIPHLAINDKVIGLEDIREIFGSSINMDVFKVKYNKYYRRLVSEPIAKSITDFCNYSVSRMDIDVRMAEEWFEILCYMCYVLYEVRI